LVILSYIRQRCRPTTCFLIFGDLM